MSTGVLPTVLFGSSDLRVTRLCQGTAFRTLEREAGDRQAEAVLRHCLDVGVQFFDSSNAYGWGGAERLLGQALRGRGVWCGQMGRPSGIVAAQGGALGGHYMGPGWISGATRWRQ